MLQNAYSEHNIVLVIDQRTLTLIIKNNQMKKNIQYKYGSQHTLKMTLQLATTGMRLIASLWIINHSISSGNDCTVGEFANQPMYNNIKPSEVFLKEANISTRECSTMCFRDISCKGFLVDSKDDGGLCSTYKDRFRSFTKFVNLPGSRAYGKIKWVSSRIWKCIQLIVG